MPLIDVKCPADHVSEVHRPLAMWPATPPCVTCGQPTEQIHLPKAVQWTPDPVVVFRGPDGVYRFPGDPNGRAAAKYARDGFERVELRGAADVRRFERHMNKHEFSRACNRAEFMQRAREAREKDLRGQLRMKGQSMSRRGRDLMRAAFEYNDGKPREKGKDPGFYSEVYSMDRSNRDESRDPQGRRRRD